MPYFRRYGGYGRRYRRWYNRRGWTRSWRRGGMNRRTANGTRTMSMVIPIENTLAVVVPASSYNSTVCGIVPFWYNPSNVASELLNGSLFTTDLYRTYCNLYDEMKIDWMSVEIGVMDAVGSGATFSAVRLWTCVDRKVVRMDLSNPPTANQIRTASSAQGTLMVNNSRCVTRRYVAASDLSERISYHDCSMNVAAADNVYDSAWFNSLHDVAFFSPGLYFFFEVNSAPRDPQTINLSIRIKYGVTFRNAKFGLAANAPAAANVSHVKVEPVGTKVAGKSESEKPTVTGMAKEALARLALYVSDGVAEYDNGDNDWREDLEFLLSKVGVDGVRKFFPEGSCGEYDEYLKERGVMDDDPTEVVKDTKS